MLEGHRKTADTAHSLAAVAVVAAPQPPLTSPPVPSVYLCYPAATSFAT